MKNVSNWIKYYVYGQLKTIMEVEEKTLVSANFPKEKIRICVIDDEGFEIDNLYSLGYRDIVKHFEFSDINDYENYDVILCDVDGVGRRIDSQRQGIAISEHIKMQFPNKLVYLYSGKTIANYGNLPDGVLWLPKHGPTSDMSTRILSDFQESIKPRNIWNNAKYRLSNEGASSKTIAFLEDLFVRSIIEKENYFSLNSYGIKKRLSINIRPEWVSLISSGVKLILLFKEYSGT